MSMARTFDLVSIALERQLITPTQARQLRDLDQELKNSSERQEQAAEQRTDPSAAERRLPDRAVNAAVGLSTTCADNDPQSQKRSVGENTAAEPVSKRPRGCVTLENTGVGMTKEADPNGPVVAINSLCKRQFWDCSWDYQSSEAHVVRCTLHVNGLPIGLGGEGNTKASARLETARRAMELVVPEPPITVCRSVLDPDLIKQLSMEAFKSCLDASTPFEPNRSVFACIVMVRYVFA